jgi:hypothetical protein
MLSCKAKVNIASRYIFNTIVREVADRRVCERSTSRNSAQTLNTRLVVCACRGAAVKTALTCGQPDHIKRS